MPGLAETSVLSGKMMGFAALNPSYACWRLSTAPEEPYQEGPNHDREPALVCAHLT
jgi:hypothetical protein